MNLFNKLFIFVVILLVLYYQNILDFNNLTKTVLGRALLVFAIIYITTNYGAILGILMGIVVILMLHDTKEGATGEIKIDDKKVNTDWPDEVPVKLLIPTKMSKTDLENALNRSKEEATAEASGQFGGTGQIANAVSIEAPKDSGGGGGTSEVLAAAKEAVEDALEGADVSGAADAATTTETGTAGDTGTAEAST